MICLIRRVCLKLILLCFIFWSCSSDDKENDNTNTPITISGNNKPTGTSANELLASNSFDRLIIEIVHVEGFAPTENTIASFRNFLNQRLHKPQGIEILQTSIMSPGKSIYTLQDIIDLEMTNRTKYNSEKEIAVFAFFADGDYSENTENSSVLGAAYRNTSFVIFEKTIQQFSQGTFAPSLEVLETTVVHHEFGHLMGLVNAGSPLQSDHQDVEHGRHCTVNNCLMYYTAETGEGIINMLSGGSIPVLESQCIADLQANGGK